MVTKTDEQKAREAFKQALLLCSRWKLRQHAAVAGVPLPEMKAAETESPNKMVDLILEKYDSGWRPTEPALNTPNQEAPKANAQKAKEEPAPTPTPTQKQEPQPQQDAAEPEPESSQPDPWDTVNTSGGDEDDDSALLASLGLDEEESEDNVYSSPPPTGATRQETLHAYAGVEVSGLEDKVDAIHDLLTKTVDLLLALSKSVNNAESTLSKVQQVGLEHKEIALRIWALLGQKIGLKGVTTAFKKGVEQAANVLNGNKN